jgi:hypothetical protein
MVRPLSPSFSLIRVSKFARPTAKSGSILTNIRPLYEAPCHHVLQLAMTYTERRTTPVAALLHLNFRGMGRRNPRNAKKSIGVQRSSPFV